MGFSSKNGKKPKFANKSSSKKVKRVNGGVVDVSKIPEIGARDRDDPLSLGPMSGYDILDKQRDDKSDEDIQELSELISMEIGNSIKSSDNHIPELTPEIQARFKKSETTSRSKPVFSDHIPELTPEIQASLVKNGSNSRSFSVFSGSNPESLKTVTKEAKSLFLKSKLKDAARPGLKERMDTCETTRNRVCRDFKRLAIDYAGGTSIDKKRYPELDQEYIKGMGDPDFGLAAQGLHMLATEILDSNGYHEHCNNDFNLIMERHAFCQKFV